MLKLSKDRIKEKTNKKKEDIKINRLINENGTKEEILRLRKAKEKDLRDNTTIYQEQIKRELVERIKDEKYKKTKNRLIVVFGLIVIIIVAIKFYDEDRINEIANEKLTVLRLN